MKQLVVKVHSDIGATARQSIREQVWLSVMVSVFVLVAVYRDLWYIRFVSGIVPNPRHGDETFQDYVFGGLSGVLNKSIVNFNRQILWLCFLGLVIYSVVLSYRKLKTMLYNTPSASYAKELSETGQFMLLTCVAFCVPLVYWPLFLVFILPKLAALPLAYVASGDVITLCVSFGFVLLATIFCVHVGLSLTRLAFRWLYR